MGKLKHITETCREIYEKEGFSAVCDYVNEYLDSKHPMPDLGYEFCKACDTEAPAWNHICLACGQGTHPALTKQQLVDAVIDDLKKDFAVGDYTVLDELLNKLSVKTLVQSLPEEDWDKYKGLNNSYFEIVHQDYREDAGREEIQIHAGENGNVYLFQDGDKLGFVVDVYGLNDHTDSMTIWEEDLDDGDDEITEEEIKEFKKNWGQTHSEICANLGYSKKGSDDLLMDDYFWIEADKKWYNKEASTFTEREEEIADYLRNLN